MEDEIVDLREPAPTVTRKPRRARAVFLFVFLAIVLGGCTYLWKATRPPLFYPESVIVEIPEGTSVRGIAEILQYNGIIHSPTLFRTLVILSGRETGIQSGAYLFSEKMDLARVTRKMLTTDRGIERIRLTIPEGLNLKQTARLVSEALPGVSSGEFLTLAKGNEGYLFPDTYFFFSNATTGPVVRAMEENFDAKTAEIKSATLLAKKNWADIVTMASIIEEEAVTNEDQLMVSGILWNRIKIGMRLQVDASFAYLLGKPSSAITAEDLKIDSPYNTYLYKGLPPAPIANPGLRALNAALYPTESKYLYYLSDKDGFMHYAKTFEEHKTNKEKYLR